MPPNSRRFSGTIARPFPIRVGTSQRLQFSPSISTSPERGRTIPSTVFRVVDFPDALPPRRDTSSPSPTVSEIPSRIRIWP
jgi:hypothetical protein